MEFKQLEAFVAVVDYKSFSEAAKHLYLTQPTISSHIQALEKELNSRLLIRTTKQMKVTDRGMQLYECAVHMLNMRDQITDEFVGNKWKLIDVSASTIPSSYLLPELLSEFSKIQPDIHFHIWQSDSADAIEKRDPRALWILVLSGSKTDDRGLLFYFPSRYRLFSHWQAPVTDQEYLELADTLKKEEPVALKHFLSHPFILRANGSGTRKEIDLFLERHQINLSDLNIVARMNDLESIKKVYCIRPWSFHSLCPQCKRYGKDPPASHLSIGECCAGPYFLHRIQQKQDIKTLCKAVFKIRRTLL